MNRTSLNLFWLVFVLSLVLCNEYNLHWLAAVVVGKYSIVDGFKDVYQFSSQQQFLFSLALRSVLFLVLAIMVFILWKIKSPAIYAIAWSGLLGVVGILIFAYWSIEKTYYMDMHVSSTSAIGYLIAAILAVPSGLAGGLLGRIFYWIRYRK